MQAKNPKIFGEHGGNSRISSMTEVAFSLGLVIGPILAGSLTELVGYYYMNFVFCEYTFVNPLSSSLLMPRQAFYL